MNSVAALRLNQFGVRFYEVLLTGVDVQKIVQFEVLNFGPDGEKTIGSAKRRASGSVSVSELSGPSLEIDSGTSSAASLDSTATLRIPVIVGQPDPTAAADLDGLFSSRYFIDARQPDGIARVAEELHHQYALGFTPTTLDGKMHKLEVRVVESGLTARARRSYLATQPRS